MAQRALSLKEKINILDAVKSRPKNTPQRALARDLEIPRSTLQKLLQNEKSIRNEAASLHSKSVAFKTVKRHRQGKDPEVEEALLLWFTRAVNQGLPVSGPLLMDKARRLASDLGKDDFQPTDGWLNRWKQRNNVCFKKVHGEAGSADVEAAHTWTETLPQLLEKYDAGDVYNADETGLYYRATPDGSLVFRETVIKGSKKALARITLLVCCNMDGSDRLKLLVVGKSKQPRCFKGVNMQKLSVTYTSNQAAWMTAAIFTDWIKEWDRKLTSQGRSILLLVDNASCHPPVELTSINLQFLPPNTTALVQPLDQGIIKNLKHFYRESLRSRIVDALDDELINAESSVAEVSKQIDLMDAIHMVATAWQSVQSTTIKNCFRKAGFHHDSHARHDGEAECEAEDEAESESEDYLRLEQDIQCHQTIAGDEDIIEAVIAKRSRQEKTQESDSEEEPDPIPPASQLLANLRETQRLLLREGKPELCPQVQQVMSAVREIRQKSLIQIKISFLK
jgi:hypothetical protein